MRIFDIITKKKRGEALTFDEIDFLVHGYTVCTIDDAPMAALLMAICLQGFNREETSALTLAMAHSGQIADLVGINLPVVDKHSTGGVGDKLTLTVGPIAAACGIAVAKMSGRALGHTGGTIDKLEVIPGFRTDLAPAEFIACVNKIGIAITGQSAALAPADKKIYALRDKTATVDSVPLIAASIMSKKIAAGADSIVLDVKAGSGAFMKTAQEAEELAAVMVQIGRDCGKNMAALVTTMDAPLGRCVGNMLEVAEAAEVLRGGGDSELTELSIELAAQMLSLGGKGDLDVCKKMAQNAISSGAAYRKFLEMIEAQGGDARFADGLSLAKLKDARQVVSPSNGYVQALDGEACGIAASILGGGIIFRKKPDEAVQNGDVLAEMYSQNEAAFAEANSLILGAYKFGAVPPAKTPLIHSRIN